MAANMAMPRVRLKLLSKVILPCCTRVPMNNLSKVRRFSLFSKRWARAEEFGQDIDGLGAGTYEAFRGTWLGSLFALASASHAQLHL